MEPDNRDAVCVDKDQTVVGHLKKGDSGKFAKTIFFSSEVVPTVTVMLKFQGNDATWKMEKGYKSLEKLSYRDIKICKYIETWITKNQWTIITQILVMYFSIHKKFEL